MTLSPSPLAVSEADEADDADDESEEVESGLTPPPKRRAGARMATGGRTCGTPPVVVVPTGGTPPVVPAPMGGTPPVMPARGRGRGRGRGMGANTGAVGPAPGRGRGRRRGATVASDESECGGSSVAADNSGEDPSGVPPLLSLCLDLCARSGGSLSPRT